MPTESELRDLLQGGSHPSPQLDAGRIIRRAHARRRPKQLAVGALGGLAMVAVVVPLVLGGGAHPMSGGDAGGSAADAPEQDTMSTLERGAAGAGPAPVLDALNPCGAELAAATSDPAGLVLAMEPLEAPADADWIDAEVTLTNTGESTVHGITGATPTLTLAHDGVVLWHGVGLTAPTAVMIELAPGESTTLAATFRPVRCAAGGDADAASAALPEAGPGDYTLSPAISFTPDDGSGSRTIVGAPSTLVLR